MVAMMISVAPAAVGLKQTQLPLPCKQLLRHLLRHPHHRAMPVIHRKGHLIRNVLEALPILDPNRAIPARGHVPDQSTYHHSAPIFTADGPSTQSRQNGSVTSRHGPAGEAANAKRSCFTTEFFIIAPLKKASHPCHESLHSAAWK